MRFKLVITALLLYFSTANASGPATFPYAFLKAKQFSCKTIGQMATASGGFVLGKLFATGTTDGAFPIGVESIAVDPTNDFFYVAEFSNNRVSKFRLSTGAFIGAIGKTASSTGTCPTSGTATGWCTGGIFTSGGTTDGTFNGPTGVAIDVANSILFVTEAKRISKFNTVTGAFIGAIGKMTATTGSCTVGINSAWCTGGTPTTGNTDGAFNSIGDLAYDATHDNLFVYQISNSRLDKFTASSGAFIGSIGKTSATGGSCPANAAATTWCTGAIFANGSGDGMFGGTGISVDPTNGFIFVSDGTNHRVQKIDLTSGAFIGSIGNTSATSGTCPATGAAPGWCTGGTFAIGTTDGTFSAPWHVVVDPVSKILYVADQNTNAVIKVDELTGAFIGAVGNTTATSGTCPASGAAPSWCTGGTFATGNNDGMYNFPASLAIDLTHGKLYVGESIRVSRLTLSTGAFTGATGAVSYRFTTWSSSPSTYFPAGPPPLNDVDGTFSSNGNVAIDVANGFLYAGGSNRVAKVNLTTGAFIGHIGLLSASNGTCPASGAATTWCTGGTFTSGSTDGAFNSTASLALDTISNILYVTDKFRISKYNASTGAFLGAIGKTSATTGSCPASGAAPSWCTGGTFVTGATDNNFTTNVGELAIDHANDLLYVTDGSKVAKMVLSTGAFVGAIGQTTATTGTCPSAATATGWCTGGSFTSGPSRGAFNIILGIAIDTANDVMYVSNRNNNRIDKFVLSTGAYASSIGKTTSSSGTCPATGATPGWCTGGTFGSGTGDQNYNLPGPVSFDAGRDFLYIDDSSNNRFVKIKASTGAFVGAVGRTATSTGTCTTNNANWRWCTGGAFSAGLFDRMFTFPAAVTVDTSNNRLYLIDNGRILKCDQ